MGYMRIGGDYVENSKTKMRCADCKHYEDDPLGMGFGHCELKKELALAFDRVCADGDENTSTADVAPVRHGRWVESFKVNAPPTLKLRWVCSWCGNVQTYGATDYCPNCGAKMDEGDEDETDRR